MYNKNFRLSPTEKQVIGQIGEDFACGYLSKIGHKIIERNYLKKWGELDIVSSKAGRLYFTEVKTVTRDTLPVEGRIQLDVTNDSYRAEDNIHHWKLKRLGRAIQSYLLDRNVSDETEWQFDVVTVYLDKDKRLIKIVLLEDIVL